MHDAPPDADTGAREPARAPSLFDAQHRSLTIGLVSIVTLVAFESLAVITILPDIEADLRGLAWYGWVTSAFFLGTMIGIVFAGSQADRHGLGRPYVVGLIVFAIGLVVAGLAPSMPALVLGRCVQGFGAGVVPAIGYVAIGRAYPVGLRPRMFAVLSTAWLVPAVFGPVLSERVSAWVGWRWVFLGLLPLVAVVGAVIVPVMLRLRAPDDVVAVPRARWARRRMPEAVRVATGTALMVAGLTRGGWSLVPLVAAGALVGLGPLRRLTPAGTLVAAVGLPAVIVSRGLMTFAFFSVDTFVPYAITSGKGASTFAGSVAVTAATLGWVTATWVQQRFIVRTGEALFVRIGYVVLACGIGVVAGSAAAIDLPLWTIHVGAALAGFGIGLGYSAHSQATLRLAPAGRYGESTASLQLCDNLGIALGAGLSGAIVAFGDSSGWHPGPSVAAALVLPITVALGGVFVAARRFPPA